MKLIEYFATLCRGTTFIILRPDKTILMQLRDNNSKKYKNMWCFPGGVCDGTEKYINTAIREAKEEYELTLTKENCTLLKRRLKLSALIYVYVCNIDDIQTPVLHEGADMKWMNIDEIKQLKLGFRQSCIIPKLDKYLK